MSVAIYHRIEEAIDALLAAQVHLSKLISVSTPSPISQHQVQKARNALQRARSRLRSEIKVQIHDVYKGEKLAKLRHHHGEDS